MTDIRLIYTLKQAVGLSASRDPSINRGGVRPTKPVMLGLEGQAAPIGGVLRAAPPGKWQTLAVPLRPLARSDVDMPRAAVPSRLTTAGQLALAVFDIRLAGAAIPPDQCGQPQSCES
jgi:hypothetical protein